MKDAKRRKEIFSFYDHTGMERHLEKMAWAGWMVEKLRYLWHYKHCEPRELKFGPFTPVLHVRPGAHGGGA